MLGARIMLTNTGTGMLSTVMAAAHIDQLADGVLTSLRGLT
jgi:hypothetical protein